MHRIWLLLAGAALMSLPPSAPVRAHPHLWIDVSAEIGFAQSRAVGIRFKWIFDEFFSAGVIGEFDKNGNKSFDPDEIDALRQGAFEGTKEAGFFTDLQIDGAKIQIETTRDFSARIEKGIAIYEFTVPLPEPIDPVKQSLTISIYDPSYFVDITFIGNDPVKFAGADATVKCAATIEDDRINPIYGGAIFPKKATVECRSGP